MARLALNSRGRYPGTLVYERFPKGTTAEAIAEKMEIEVEDVFRIISNPACWEGLEGDELEFDEELEDEEEDVEFEDGLDNLTIPQLRLVAESRQPPVEIAHLRRKQEIIDALRKEDGDDEPVD